MQTPEAILQGCSTESLGHLRTGAPLIFRPLRALVRRASLKRRAQSPPLPATSKLLITPSALQAIRETIGASQAEQGGVLGGDRASGLVTHFHFDRSANRTRTTYSPDHERLN